MINRYSLWHKSYVRHQRSLQSFLMTAALFLIAATHTPPANCTPTTLASTKTSVNALTDSAIHSLPGLNQAVWVNINDEQRLKILAQNDHDAFYMLGYHHAQDRFFQMDVNRRRITGELAALLGEAALLEDYRNRMLGVQAAAERTWHILDKDTQDILSAYSDGVNAYLNHHALPTEYTALHLKQARPWTPIDSIAIMKALSISLSLSIDITRSDILQTYQQRGKEKGFDGHALYFRDTHPIQPITANTTYDSAGVDPPYARVFQGSSHTSPPALKGAVNNKTENNRTANTSIANTSIAFPAHALSQLRHDLMVSSVWRSFFHAENISSVGSNFWAISGKHSKTGNPIIANDPHLPTTWPGVFYPVHLRVTNDPKKGHMNAAGASLPGVPAMAHGQNTKLIWSSTNHALDVSDVFLDQLILAHPANASSDTKKPFCQTNSGLCIVSEGTAHPVVLIPQTYHVNTSTLENPNRFQVVEAPEPYQQLMYVPFRNFGPVLRVLTPATPEQAGQALVLQFTGFAGTRELQALTHWLRAETVHDFFAALPDFEVGSQNWLVADTVGNLAYFSSAKSPLRRDLEAGEVVAFGPAFIRPGDGRANWIQNRTEDHIPQNSPVYLTLDRYETLPASEMPSIINPPSGILVNANNDPTGQTRDGNPYNQVRLNRSKSIYYLSHEYSDGLRAKRITDRLQQRLTASIQKPKNEHQKAKNADLSFADLRDIQRENTQQDATLLLPYLMASHQRHCVHTEAFSEKQTSNAPSSDPGSPFTELCSEAFLTENLSRLATWNFTTPAGIDWPSGHITTNTTLRQHSFSALYYHLWRAHLIRNLIYKPLEKLALPQPAGRFALRAVIQHITSPTFSCTGYSGLDFCGSTPITLSDTDRRDYALLDALIDAHETLNSAEYKAHLRTTKLHEWVWGALHRQEFLHPMDPEINGTFSVPSQQVYRQFVAWKGFPRSGGYEVVNAAPLSPDAIAPGEMTSHAGPARRVVGGPKGQWLRKTMTSESVLPNTRRTTFLPEHQIQQWLDNQQTLVLKRETFMRLRWHKIRPEN